MRVAKNKSTPDEWGISLGPSKLSTVWMARSAVLDCCVFVTLLADVVTWPSIHQPLSGHSRANASRPVLPSSNRSPRRCERVRLVPLSLGWRYRPNVSFLFVLKRESFIRALEVSYLIGERRILFSILMIVLEFYTPQALLILTLSLLARLFCSLLNTCPLEPSPSLWSWSLVFIQFPPGLHVALL